MIFRFVSLKLILTVLQSEGTWNQYPVAEFIYNVVKNISQ